MSRADIRYGQSTYIVHVTEMYINSGYMHTKNMHKCLFRLDLKDMHSIFYSQK
jgi:hypothetical protein